MALTSDTVAAVRLEIEWLMRVYRLCPAFLSAVLLCVTFSLAADNALDAALLCNFRPQRLFQRRGRHFRVKGRDVPRRPLS